MSAAGPEGYRVFAFLVAAGVLGIVLLDLAASGTWVEHAQAAERWCKTMNGSITIENAIIDGGIHCRTPDGDLVRYTDQNL